MDVDADAVLLSAARHDGEAFGRFYDRNHRRVLAFFLRRTASPQVAAELTAETFAAALAGLHRYQPALGGGRAWLFGIATNQFKQWLRRGRVERSYLQRVGASLPTASHDDLAEIERLVDFAAVAPLLRDALGSLTPGVRAAVELRILDQLPYREVAERLMCSEVNARVRVARGLSRLAALMESPDDGQPSP